MKKVSIRDLKQHLATVLDDAAADGPVLVTRHGKPLVEIVPAGLENVIVGSRHGSGDLQPELTRGTRGRYREALAEDRRGGSER